MRKTYLRTATALFVIGCLCGLVRWSRSITTIPAEALTFSFLHDIEWDADHNRMTRTGVDPYFGVSLPAEAFPLGQVSFEFGGAYIDTEGTFYFLRTPASRENKDSSEAVTAAVTRTLNGFIVSADLFDSTGLRLDLPDFLPRSIELRHLQVRKPFVDWTQWSFRLILLSFVFSLAALVMGLKHSRVSRPLKRRMSA